MQALYEGAWSDNLLLTWICGLLFFNLLTNITLLCLMTFSTTFGIVRGNK